MNFSRLVAFALLICVAKSRGASTINSSDAYSYGANIGWMNWRPSAADGVEIGEYVVSGWIYGANVGWIRVGNGLPANGIQYSNASATDFGVNYSIDPAIPGKAILRGFAYGANIGWINFEGTGNARLRFTDGKLEGYAWSANCGWINLGDGSFAVKTDFVSAGRDSDNDGMADAFEFLYLGGLGANPNADSDGDGMTNQQEYLEGTNPLVANDALRLVSFAITARDASNTTTRLLWTSNLSRLYAIDTTTDLAAPNWTDLNIDGGPNSIIPATGATTTRSVTLPATGRRFFRVRAVRPLVP